MTPCRTLLPVLLTTATLVSAQVTATFTTFGQGCPGTGLGLGGTTIAPAMAATNWGSGNAIPFGWSPVRFQQVLSVADLPQALTMAGVSLRQPHTGPVAQRFTVDLELRIGYTLRTGAALSSTFDANWDVAPPVLVVPRQQVVFPDQLAGYPQSPDQFLLTIPWATTFQWVPQAGRNLLVEVVVHGNSWGNGVYGYPIDNVSGTTAIWGTPANTAVANGYGGPRAFGPAFGFVAQTSTAVPSLFSTQTPQIGDQFRIRVAQCAPSAGVFLLAGFATSQWSGQPLPLDLGGYGAAGCAVLLAPAATDVLVASAAGTTNRQYDLPNNIYLLGLHLFHQAFVVDPLANGLGLAASNGGDGLLGNQ